MLHLKMALGMIASVSLSVYMFTQMSKIRTLFVRTSHEVLFNLPRFQTLMSRPMHN